MAVRATAKLPHLQSHALHIFLDPETELDFPADKNHWDQQWLSPLGAWKNGEKVEVVAGGQLYIWQLYIWHCHAFLEYVDTQNKAPIGEPIWWLQITKWL